MTVETAGNRVTPPRRPAWPLGRARCTGAIASLVLTLVACGKAESSESNGPSMIPSVAAKDEAKAVDDDALAQRYLELKTAFEDDPKGFGGSPQGLAEITRELRAMSNAAKAVPLQANAAALLAAIHYEHGGWAEAVGAYRRATQLVPDDPDLRMALVRALAKNGELSAAAEAQLRAIELAPDDLEQYLVLGELRIRAGDKDGGAKAYADYEVRRLGLIDGLTLKRGDAYRVTIDERIACAEHLAVAADVGTAFALLYALENEPEPRVRTAIVEAMGAHRFVGYEPRLTSRLGKETDPDVRAAIAWALAEIKRDPIDTRLDTPPVEGAPPPTPPKSKLDAPAGGAVSDRPAPQPDATPASGTKAAAD
jgi:tetratricopeptide (TPR) repeat protein